jgi:hypothetical protein
MLPEMREWWHLCALIMAEARPAALEATGNFSSCGGLPHNW